MQGMCYFLLLVFCTALHPYGYAQRECMVDSGKGHQVYLSVSSKRNDREEWITSFSANKSSRIQPEKVDVDVAKKYTLCQGNHVFSIAGIIREVSGTIGVNFFRSLGFHPRHGKNIKLTNNRRTALLIDENKDNGVVYTDRPLRREEMLTVKYDRANFRRLYNMGIGVTSHTPYDANVPDQYIHTVQKMWLYYHSHFYINGTRVIEDYGVPMDSDEHFKVGDTVGVMVSQSGELHYFINGVDQGPAARDIPIDVYGVVELRFKAVQVTIME